MLQAAPGRRSLASHGKPHGHHRRRRAGRPLHPPRAAVRRQERLQAASAQNPLGEAWRAEALQMPSEPGDMRGGFGSLAQQGFPARFPGRSAYRQIKHTSAGMQEGAASPFLSHPQRRRVRRQERLQAASAQKPLGGGLEGRSPPNAIRTRRHARRVRKPCAAYHTSAGMQEGAASPFPCHPQRRRVRREERLQAASAIMFRPCALRTGT